MATSYADVSVTTTWTDLTVANSALIGVPVVLQKKDKGRGTIYVFFGGASAPASNESGIPLFEWQDATDGTAADIWVRADYSGAKLYTALKDS